MNSSRILKIVAVFLFSTLAYVSYQRWSIYPLTLRETEGYLLQIPISYWLGIGVLIGLMFILNYILRNTVVSLLSTILFYLLIGSYHFLFPGTAGGGYSPIRVYHSRTSAFVTSDFYRSGQYPQQMILSRIQRLVVEPGYDLTAGIELSFFVHIILFAIAVWAFVYFNLENNLYAFVGATLFFIIVHPAALRFRFVPQFFGLILLIFLFAIHHKSGKRWLLGKLGLFIVLVLSHPMMFIYYLIPVLLLPVVSGIWEGLRSSKYGNLDPLVYHVLYSLRTPLSLGRSILSGIYNELYSKTWKRYASIVLSIYFVFYLYRFVSDQDIIIELFTEPGVDAAAIVIYRLLGVEIEYEPRIEPVSTNPVFSITSVEISTITSDLTLMLVITIVLILVLTTLFQGYEWINPIHIAIFFAAGIHFLVGIVFPIHGRRALQIIFLPLILSIGVIDKRRITLIIIFMILIASPIVAVNTLNNAELSGGERQLDYYSEVSGQHLEQYGYEALIQPRGTNIHPIKIEGDKNHISIINVLELDGRSDPQLKPEFGTLIQFDYRLYHQIAYHLNKCDFSRFDVIYDNGNKLKQINHHGFSCEKLS